MRRALAQVLKDARSGTGISQDAIARHLDVNSTQPGRWEGAKMWPQDVDATVAAYAELCGVPEAELWARALARRNEFASQHAREVSRAAASRTQRRP